MLFWQPFQWRFVSQKLVILKSATLSDDAFWDIHLSISYLVEYPEETWLFPFINLVSSPLCQIDDRIAFKVRLRCFILQASITRVEQGRSPDAGRDCRVQTATIEDICDSTNFLVPYSRWIDQESGWTGVSSVSVRLRILADERKSCMETPWAWGQPCSRAWARRLARR